MPFDLTFALTLISLSMVLILSRRARFAGTTLTAPSIWSLCSLLVLGAVELRLATTPTDESSATAFRYLAATSTFCPLMAILGAKRPQNTGWQFIVLTLWIVLILPVGEMFVLWRGGDLDDGPMRRWFLLILLLLGFSNYMLTRFSFAALLMTSGQVAMLLGHLPFLNARGPGYFRIGIGLVAASVIVAWWQTRRYRQADDWNVAWCDFRDAFGLVWGLRVMERVNSTAQLCAWPTQLSWFGFESAALSEEQQTELDRTLRTVLRRFVSPEWIDRRKG